MGNKLLVGCLVFLNICNNQSHGGMHLNDVLNHALATSIDIKSMQAKKDAAKYGKYKSISSLLPKVNMTASIGKDYTKTKEVDGEFEKKDNINAHQFKLSTQYEVFNGFDSVFRYNIGKWQYSHQKHLFAANVNDHIYKAMDAYVSVRMNQRLYRLSLRNITINNTYLNNVEKLFKSGKVDLSKVHIMKSKLADAHSLRNDIYGELARSIALFIDKIGMAPGYLHNARLNSGYFPTNLKNCIDFSRLHNPLIFATRSLLKQKRNELGSARAELAPKVSLVWDYNHNENNGDKIQKDKGHKIRAEMRWNIFNGLNDCMGYKVASHNKIQARYDYLASMKNIERDVRIFWAERLSSQKQIQALQESLKLKQRLLRSYHRMFMVGRTSLVQLLDVHNDFFATQGKLIRKEAAFDLAQSKLLTLLGSPGKAMRLNMQGKIYQGRPLNKEAIDPSVIITESVMTGNIYPK